MSEHQTQGRQGQASRRRHYNKNNNRKYSRRPRTPREPEKPAPKPSLFQRILSFFGFGPKKAASKKVAEGSRPNRNNQKFDKDNKPNTKTKRKPQEGSVRQRVTSNPPTRNARLHVGNLSYEATETELEELFKGFGTVRSVTVIYNRRTYKSKGYAFVEMRYLEDAKKAAEVLHGQPFMGRELMVSAADDRHDEEKEDGIRTEEAPARKPVQETLEFEAAPAAESTPAPQALTEEPAPVVEAAPVAPVPEASPVLEAAAPAAAATKSEPEA